jgi:hypothetical protein
MMTLRSALVGIAALVLASVPAIALATNLTFTLGSAGIASGADLFAGCTTGADPDADPPSAVYNGTAVEPYVASDPSTPLNLIGVYQQDRWTDGGAKGLAAVHSADGGATWSAANSAEFSQCADDVSTNFAPEFKRATDPWVSFDSNGTAYWISLGIDSAALAHNGVEVATSTDNGDTWSLPVRLATTNDSLNFLDKTSITGDWRPTVGEGKAYATWIQGNLPGGDNSSFLGQIHSFAYRGLPMFSKTTDGGATWSKPISMVNSNVYIQGNQIEVLPDGTLVDIGALLFRGAGFQPTSTQYFWVALVSKDGGKTWGGPITVAPLGTALLTNPDYPNPTSLDQTVRAGDYLPDVAVDHSNGNLYMVFANNIGGGIDHVMFTRSINGGKSWSTPVDVTETPDTTHSFNGTVEVTGDGIVAVMYYDFRNNTDTTPGSGLPTDVWLRHSHDAGLSWSDDQHVYGSFNMEDAPVARGWFLGDYQGLTAVGNDLDLFFSVPPSNDHAVVESVTATQP